MPDGVAQVKGTPLGPDSSLDTESRRDRQTALVSACDFGQNATEALQGIR